jgi:hypothetical protein
MARRAGFLSAVAAALASSPITATLDWTALRLIRQFTPEPTPGLRVDAHPRVPNWWHPEHQPEDRA